MKAVVAAFNQEKALVGAFSVIVQAVVEPMDHFTALIWIDISIALSAQDCEETIAECAGGRCRCQNVRNVDKWEKRGTCRRSSKRGKAKGDKVRSVPLVVKVLPPFGG